MKILLDARLYGLENAGLGRYTMNLISELVKIDKKNKYVVLLRKEYFDQLNFPSNWKKVLADFRHYTIREQLLLPGILNKEKPDLVHFLSSYSSVFYKGKFIVTLHDLLMQKHRGAQATTLPLYLYYPKHLAAKFVFRKTVEKTQSIIVPSNAVKKEVIDYYRLNPNKVKVIYEGVDASVTYHVSSIKIEKPYFVYVGNAYPHKNLEKAVEAVVRLNEVGEKNITFAIASSRNVFTGRLEKLIRKLRAEKYVKLLGFVPEESLGKLLKESMAFIYPSLSEGFGLQGLEAMVAGTICLASDIPVFREVYKDAAIYFDPYSVDSITEAMNRALAMNDELRAKRLSYASKFVKHYSWSKMAKETLEIYQSV